jgi:hypothetical protein
VTKKNAPRHLADAKGAGSAGLDDRAHPNPKPDESKQPRHRVAQGDVVHVLTAHLHLSAGVSETPHFFWVVVKPLQVTDAVVRAAIQTGVGLHGPFLSEDEARIDAFGPDCKFTDGGRWDPAWEKPQ